MLLKNTNQVHQASLQQTSKLINFKVSIKMENVQNPPSQIWEPLTDCGSGLGKTVIMKKIINKQIKNAWYLSNSLIKKEITTKHLMDFERGVI